MPANPDHNAVAKAVRVYQWLLIIYPARFRAEFGPAMVQLFRDQCRDAWNHSQRRGLMRLWFRVLMDLAKASSREHLSSLRTFDVSQAAAFKRVFVVVFVCMIAFSIGEMFWTPRIYSGTCRIETEEDQDGIRNFDPYFMSTQCRIIRSHKVLTNAITGLRLESKLPAQAGDTNAWTMEQTCAALSLQTSALPIADTKLIEIKVRNRDPKLAADIANWIVDAYRQARIEERNRGRLAPIFELQAELDGQETRLAVMESNLTALRISLHVSELDHEDTTAGSLHPYFDLKKKTEELRRDTEEFNRTIHREMAEVGGERFSVIVRDPARPNLQPIWRGPQIFFTWALAGMFISLAAGGVAAGFYYLTRKHLIRRDAAVN